MSLIERLFKASNSVNELETFIQSNSIEIYDFFISQSNSSILKHRNGVEEYILPKYRIYSALDFTEKKNQTFIYCLLDVSQRFGLSIEFQQLYNLSRNNNIPLNSRLIASSLFLLGVNSIDDFEERIREILTYLSTSFLKEEDNSQKTIATVIHFYKEVFYNFPHNIARVHDFRDKLIKELHKEEYVFLLTNHIDQVLSFSLANIDELYQAVQVKLDEILERASQYLAFNVEPQLIESDTHYAELLAGISGDFREIRNLNAILYSVVASNELFWSLQRGVKVLTEQNQLIAYLNSYGKMHEMKMQSAINQIENIDLEGKLEIYDWGCGQGLATMCYLQYLNENKIDYFVNKITLIEPSEIAIKRASLHIRKFALDSQIITINKDLDSLKHNDIESNDFAYKVHLFSNILDIDLYSMKELINLMKEKFSGKNIFICVSPYVSNYKTERINNFVQSFSNNEKFKIISEISEKSGEWVGTTWSRVIRVFKCEI